MNEAFRVILKNLGRTLEMWKKKETERNKPKKVLVKLPNYVGDIIMCLSVLYAIRKAFPREESHEVHLLTEDQFSDLLYSHADNFDSIIAPDWNPHKLWPFKIARLIKPRKYDVVISFTRQPRFIVGFWLAHIPIRAAYKSFSTGLLLNVGLPEKRGKESAGSVGQANYYLDLAQKVSHFIRCDKILSVEKEHENVSLQVDNQRRREAIDIVSNNMVEHRPREIEGFPKPFYVIIPGTASTQYGNLKKWPLWNFVKVAERISETEMELKPVPLFLFGPSEGKIYDHFMSEFSEKLPKKTIVIKPGSTRLSHVMAIIEQSEFVLTGDTGPRHIATKLSKKVVSIFGPMSIGRATYASYLELPIWINVGCNLTECKVKKCKEKHICMRSVTPGLVYEKIMEFIYNVNIRDEGR